MNCPYCHSPLSCGCQKRKASDGKDVCSNCIAQYEQILGNLKDLEANKKVELETPSAPTDVRVTFTRRNTEQP